jgi:hypothetical protein
VELKQKLSTTANAGGQREELPTGTLNFGKETSTVFAGPAVQQLYIKNGFTDGKDLEEKVEQESTTVRNCQKLGH